MNCGPREMVRSRPCEATLHQRQCLAGDRTQLVVRERESMQQGAGLLLGGWDEMACNADQAGRVAHCAPVSVESRRMTGTSERSVAVLRARCAAATDHCDSCPLPVWLQVESQEREHSSETRTKTCTVPTRNNFPNFTLVRSHSTGNLANGGAHPPSTTTYPPPDEPGR